MTLYIFGNRTFFVFARQLTQSSDKKVHLEGCIMLKYHSVSMRSLFIIMLVSYVHLCLLWSFCGLQWKAETVQEYLGVLPYMFP